MSKYQPLVHHLDRARGSHVPMGFREVEDVLNFPLPRSARQHQAWWANTGSHVHAVTWMKRGWRTSAVDLSGEKVVFVRGAPTSSELSPGPSDHGKGDALKEIVIAWASLRQGQQRLLTDIAEEKNISLAAAISEALDMAQRDRRRRTLEWAAANSPVTSSDSVALIRADRDRDEH